MIDVEAHHDDYRFPLEVRWLCRMCHVRWHRQHGPGAHHHLMQKAHSDVFRALNEGAMAPQPCEECGAARPRTKPRGRPRLELTERRHVRGTPEEVAAWEAAAARDGKTFPEWLRLEANKEVRQK